MDAKPHWYTLAKGFCRSSPASQEALKKAFGAELSRQRICTLRAIAKLHPNVGAVLDELEVPYYLARYVAHGQGAAEQRARAQEAIAAWAAKKDERQAGLAKALLETLTAKAA